MFFCVEECLWLQKNIGLRPINRRNTTLQRFLWKWPSIWVLRIGNTGKCHFLEHICYFEHFKMVFTKYWSWVKLFSKTRSTFWKFCFFIPCLVFDLWHHLLTSFCSISQMLPLHHLFEQSNLIFTKYLGDVKLFKVNRGKFRKKLIPCLVFDLWRHLLTSFCSISLILPLYRLFEQLNTIFTKYLWRVKLFNMTRGTIWENNSETKMTPSIPLNQS